MTSFVPGSETDVTAIENTWKKRKQNNLFPSGLALQLFTNLSRKNAKKKKKNQQEKLPTKRPVLLTPREAAEL